MRLKTPEERLAFALDQVDAGHEQRRRIRSRLTTTMIVAGVTALSSLVGCPPPLPPPVTPPDASDAAPPPPPATCSAVCATVTRLGCKGAKSCSANCPRVQSQTYKNCVRDALTCDRVNLCDQGVGNE